MMVLSTLLFQNQNHWLLNFWIPKIAISMINYIIFLYHSIEFVNHLGKKLEKIINFRLYCVNDESLSILFKWTFLIMPINLKILIRIHSLYPPMHHVITNNLRKLRYMNYYLPISIFTISLIISSSPSWYNVSKMWKRQGMRLNTR